MNVVLRFVAVIFAILLTGQSPARVPLISGEATTTVVVDQAGSVQATLQQDWGLYPLGLNAYDESAVYVPNEQKTVFAYLSSPGGDGLRGVIYDHVADTWTGPFSIAYTGLVENDHGKPALELLSDDRIMIAFGSHATFEDPGFVVSNGTDYTDWNRFTAFTDDPTYFKLVNEDGVGGAGSVHAFYRETQGSNMPLWYREFSYASGGTPTVGSAVSIIDFSGDRIYASAVRSVDDKLLFFWCRSNNADTFRRHVYAARYDPSDGSLSNFAETVTVAAGSLPISRTTGDASFRIIDQGSSETHIPSWDISENGDVHVVYSVSDGAAGVTDIMYMVSTDGATFSTPVKVTEGYHFNGSFGFQGMDAHVIVDQDGDPEIFIPQGITHGRGRGGDTQNVFRLSGGEWSGTALQAREGSLPIAGVTGVKNALPELRAIFAEHADSTSSASRAPLRFYFYGSPGVAEVPAPDPNLQFLVERVRYAENETLDLAQGAQPISLVGNATITDGKLSLDGSGDRMDFSAPGWSSGFSDRVAQNRKYNIGTDDFTIDVYGLELDDTSGVPHIWSNMGNSGSRGMSIVADITSDTLIWQAATSPNGVSTLTSTGSFAWSTSSEYFIRICRTGGVLRMFLGTDGGAATMIYKQTVTTIMQSSTSNIVRSHGGRATGASYLDGRIAGTNAYIGASLCASDDDFTPPAL